MARHTPNARGARSVPHHTGPSSGEGEPSRATAPSKRRETVVQADGEMKALEVFGDLVFERERSDLRELRAPRCGKRGPKMQHIGCGQHEHDTPPC